VTVEFDLPPMQPGADPVRGAPDGPEVLTAQEALKLLYLTYRSVKARGRKLRFVRVLFVSASRGEGTSTIARDFALVAASRAHDRVLLMDLAMPVNGQLHRAMHRGRISGLAEIPSIELGLPVERPGGQDEEGAAAATWLRFHRVRNSPLYITERHEAAKPPGEEPAGMAEFWERMRQEFELVVVDCPSVSESFDPIMLASQMDAVVLVVAAESTRAPVAQNLRDRIAEVGGPIVGVVLNRRRFHIPEFLYRRL
jgi:Mrp family chromosome partitioning ATPase